MNIVLTATENTKIFKSSTITHSRYFVKYIFLNHCLYSCHFSCIFLLKSAEIIAYFLPDPLLTSSTDVQWWKIFIVAVWQFKLSTCFHLMQIWQDVSFNVAYATQMSIFSSLGKYISKLYHALKFASISHHVYSFFLQFSSPFKGNEQLMRRFFLLPTRIDA